MYSINEIITITQKKLAQIAHVDTVQFDVPNSKAHGDISSNIALQQASKEKKNPQELANSYVNELLQDVDLQQLYQKIEVVKPGFINFYYTDSVIVYCVKQAIVSNSYGFENSVKKKTIVIEYSSPNTNKPLHVGHLRNNAIGMSLANILRFLGHTVITTEVVNDRGIHIMKSLLAYMKWGGGDTPEKAGMKGDHFVGKYYVLFNTKLQDNLKLLDEAQDLLRKWEVGDAEVRKAWKKLNTWVLEGMQQTYNRFGSKFDKQYFESDLYDKGREIVIDAVKKDLAYKNATGATVVDLSSKGLGDRENSEKVLLRKDGTTVYITQDLYLAKKRYEDFAFDSMMYVVGNEQSYHFKVLFALLEKFNLMPDAQLFHHAYAHVLLSGGRMKSREGTVVHGDDLLGQLFNIAQKEVIQRNPHLDQDEVDTIADAVSLAAIKYWFLKTNLKSTITFDPQASLDFEGNTGPYLLYTVVRLKRLVDKHTSNSIKEMELHFGEEEKELVRLVAMWPIIINSFSNTLSQNLICEYLFTLASAANSYYQNVPVLKADKNVINMRIVVLKSAAMTLEKGLNLLNIDMVDQM